MVEIPITSKRREWGDYLHGMGKFRDRPIEELLEHVGGVRILQEMETPRFQGCHWFVFKDEEWYKKMRSSDSLLQHAFRVLRMQGYEEITTSLEGIIVYSFSTSPNGQVEHYGLYRDGKVISKFGCGHVYEHDVASVPDIFGDKAVFLQKNRELILTEKYKEF